jgi:mannose-6-phosphate isomerase
VIEGHARIDMASTSVGDAMFVEFDRAGSEAGADGMSALIAYPGPDPIMSLLQESGEQMTSSADTSTQRSLPKPKEIVEAQT